MVQILNAYSFSKETVSAINVFHKSNGLLHDGDAKLFNTHDRIL